MGTLQHRPKVGGWAGNIFSSLLLCVVESKIRFWPRPKAAVGSEAIANLTTVLGMQPSNSLKRW